MKCSLRSFRKPLYSCLLSLSILFIFISHKSSAGIDEKPAIAEIYKTIVHITALQKMPIYVTPWVMPLEKNVYGSGCIISGKMILTNAHVVANQTSIRVRKSLEEKEYKAKVLFVSHEADLALLAVDDETFFSGTAPLDIGDLPVSPSKVLAFGYPNGESLRITEGTLNKMEYRKYIHSNSNFPAGEMLSEIRSGSSGGPVIYGNMIVGVVMEANKSGDVAHIIPGQVIRHFLTDISDGRYDGFPDMGLVTADSSIKNGKGVAAQGLAISHVIAGSPAGPYVKKDDILLSVDGFPVYGDGSIDLGKYGHLPYIHLVKMKQIGDQVNMSVLRAGAVRSITLTLNKRHEDFSLVPEVQYDAKPRYFIFGGIIFSPLTKNIFNECAYVPEDLMNEAVNWPTNEKKEVVVALEVLPADVNSKYHGLQNWKITEVNGKRFRDFTEFYRLVMLSNSPYVEFRDSRGFQVVIDRHKAEESHEQILRTFTIREDCSPDIRMLGTGRIAKTLSP